MTIYGSRTGLQLLLPLHWPAAPCGQEGRGPQMESECGGMTHKKQNNQKELAVHAPNYRLLRRHPQQSAALILACSSNYRCSSLQLQTGKRSTGTQTRRGCNSMTKNTRIKNNSTPTPLSLALMPIPAIAAESSQAAVSWPTPVPRPSTYRSIATAAAAPACSSWWARGDRHGQGVSGKA